MDQKENVAKFYNLINLYSDYLGSGFKRNHKLPDFSKITQKKEKIKVEKNPTNNTPIEIKIINKSLDINAKKRTIISIAEKIIKCTKCNLHEGAGKVPGAGNCNADIFVVSYPPTIEEENSGRPLIGGEPALFFKKWLNAININFEDVFVSNIIKCPPKKNKIKKENIEICINYLNEQLEIVKPKIILSLGQLTFSSLKKSFINLMENHGKIFEYNGIPFLSTYHPLDVLTDTSLKKPVWEDLKKLKMYMEGNISLNE